MLLSGRAKKSWFYRSKTIVVWNTRRSRINTSGKSVSKERSLARDRLIIIRDFIFVCYAFDLLKHDQHMKARFGAHQLREDIRKLKEVLKDIKSDLRGRRD